MKNILTLILIIFAFLPNGQSASRDHLFSRNYVTHPGRYIEVLVPWLYHPQAETSLMMTCPQDITVNLGPGACSSVVNYVFTPPNITVADSTFNQNNSAIITSTIYCPSEPTSYRRTFFNASYTDITIKEINLGVYQANNNPIITVRFTDPSGTDIYGSNQYIIPNLNTTIHNFAPSGVIKIPAQSSFVMEIISSQPGVSTFYIGRTTDPTPLEAIITGCSVPNVIGPATANSVYFGCIATPDEYKIENNSNTPFNTYNSGDAFPIGETDMTYNVYGPAGLIETCNFSIVVNEFTGASGAIVCNDLVHVTLNEDCEAIVTPDMVLEGNDYGCYDHYTVKIYAKNGRDLGNQVGKAQLGQQLKTQVFGPNGNSCWGEIIVEDKLPPVLECEDLFATCGTDLKPGSVLSETVPVAAYINDGAIGFGVKTFNIPVGNIQGSTITDLDVYLNISHSNVSHLAAEIISPSGITVPLFLQPIGCNGANIAATFDSQAIQNLICDAAIDPAISGRFKPASSLNIYNGTIMGGTWKVRIYDFVAGVDGIVNDIHLIFKQNGGKISFPTSKPIVATPLDEDTYQVTGLDGCSSALLSYEDKVLEESCEGNFDRIIERCWTAIDQTGNISRCCHKIYVYRNSLITIQFPPNFDGVSGNPNPLSCDIFGDSIPPVELTGLPNGDFCKKTQVFPPTDVIIPLCPKSYKILRTHKVIDWCTGDVIVHNQVIKVLDSTGPELECSKDVTISTDDYTCSATYIVPKPVIKKECSGVKSYRIEHRYLDIPGSEFGITGVNQSTNTITGLPLGQNEVRWIVTDSCGNQTTCSFKVIVKDDDRPTAVCDIYTVASITGGGIAIVDAETFDDGSHDNCGILKFEARKMTDRCRFGTTYFTDTIVFCCEEVNTSVMVEMKVTDVNGNVNTCMVEVKVHDKLPPYITKCPPDIELDCQANYKDLKVTGEPIYVDNCAVDSVWYKDVDSISQCGTGVIKRTWTVKDKQNLRHSCVQIITLVDREPFDGVIDWPDDYAAVKCYSALDPKSLPLLNREPRWNDDNCNLIAAHYKDQIFTFADDACVKILRKWTVIDWCTYNEFDNEEKFGIWEHIQVIKLHNDIPPQFEFACIDRTVPSYGECREYVKFTMTAIDDCPEGNDSIKWKYELFTEHGITPIALVHSRTFERSLTNGKYRVKWTIEDKCGNRSICEHKLNVVESKKPTPYCHTALTTAVMNNNGTVEIWAKDFDQGGYDNCTPKDSIIFTFFDALPVDSLFYREHYFKDSGKLATKEEYEAGNAQIWKPILKTSGMFFDCNDIPNGKSQQVSLNVSLTDEAKNQDFCTINLILQDNSNVCPDKNGIFAGVSGRVTSNNISKGTTDVIIESNAPEANRTIRTDANGQYTFSSLPLGYNYTIKMEDNRNILNGVSTLDLVMIQRHILGIEVFNDGRKTIAADIDNSQKVTAADLVGLRKVILGITDNFPNGQKSWRFMTSDLSNEGNINPFPLNEKYLYQNLSESKLNQNFYAIKIGDINQSAAINADSDHIEQRSSNTLALEADVKKVFETDEVWIPVYASSFDNILGYQFTLHFDHKNLEFKEMMPGELELKDQNFGFQSLDKGMISSSWNNSSVVHIDVSKPLFTLKFKNRRQTENIKGLTLSSVITTAEAYDSQFTKMKVTLDSRNIILADDGYLLKQNVPNPFSENTKISFVLPESESAKITISDVTGKTIKVIEGVFAKGENHVALDKQELGKTGILIYKFESGNFADTKKMIVLE